MWSSVEVSGGDFFENPWRFTALYSVGRRPCFAQSRTIILRQGQLNEQFYNSIFVKFAFVDSGIVFGRILFYILHKSQSQFSIIFIRRSSPGLFAEGVREIRRVYCAGSLTVSLVKLYIFIARIAAIYQYHFHHYTDEVIP